MSSRGVGRRAGRSEIGCGCLIPQVHALVLVAEQTSVIPPTGDSTTAQDQISFGDVREVPGGLNASGTEIGMVEEALLVGNRLL